MRGKFIVFEGIDGCGKTTQVVRLQKRLNGHNISCVCEKEPSDGLIGSLVRKAIKMETTFLPESMAMLFAADRIEHVTNVILPKLECGVSVLCDRFYFSNIAYQGLYMPMERVIEYNRAVFDRIAPDLTIFIDTDVKACIQRLGNSGDNFELFEDIEKLSAVRDNYLKAFNLLGKYADIKLEIIDGNNCEDFVADKICGLVKTFWGELF